ncbi:unnamed protein product [Spirodela intermedia]|uniref:Uncharacterized protein n=1 Tax=Spirodela intermedia TaxID=51605 RepID=A0A7I8IMI8_SPIIN|nr:unnamed protein product [Spirodela intermedia]CAA6659088.1 unnamed protein product [Spirodela intermedia]
MAPTLILYLLVLLHAVNCAPSPTRSSGASALCPREERAFLDAAVRSQCPLWIEKSSPVEPGEDPLRCAASCFLVSLLWAARPAFDALSTMFPQIRHLAVEESSAMPSLFSRFGAHSLPSIVLVNGKIMVQHRGGKDLDSLVAFYERSTGLRPVADLSVDPGVHLRRESSSVPWWWSSSAREFVTREPYLAFSLLFLSLRVFLFLFPGILLRLRAVWILVEWSQLSGRALQMIEVKRMCSKLCLSNKKNLRRGADNARAWASSLTSVSSLSESSSSRSPPQDS